MIYKGFNISYWCGIFHAYDGKKRITATREADIYEQINNYLN